MAQKAAKVLAAKNVQILNRLHLVSLCVHLCFLLLRFVIFRRTGSRSTFVLYLLFGSPSLAIELWFERIGRPGQTSRDSSRRTGEDLEAKGLTEFLWDVIYWTWGCIVAVALFGNKLWWAWLAVPVYSVYLVWKTFSGVRQGLGGMMGGGGDPGAGAWDADGSSLAESKRQKKMEKRGPKVQYK